MAKKLTLDDLYPHIENLLTSEQITLKEFITKILAAKEAQAKAELDLINGGGQ